ncbi:MAG: cyclic nucleotide-binding domain-containing protein [Desulfovibrionaceae bacterium]|nr:cyclic nucleotide-binding domain-containing protein [Desulfovibrionaceae bacterium]
MKESPYLDGREELLPRMLELPSLSGFTEGHLRDIMRLSKVRSYEPGEVILRQGQFDCWVYILISGSARVVRDGREVAKLQRSGELFGEMGVISGESRSADVIAEKPATCLAVDGSVFERKTDGDSLTMMALFFRLFAEVLAGRLRETNEELVRVKKERDRLKNKLASLDI